MDDLTTSPKSSRRTFLKAVGASAIVGVGARSLPASARAELESPSLPPWLDHPPSAERAFWRRVKNSFVLDRQTTYMNVGTTGSTPRHVLAAHAANYHKVAADPRENLGGIRTLRTRVAPHYGANDDEIVLSGNTTDGMTMTLNGLTVGMESGDAIITTNHEHPSATAPMNLLRDRRGVAVFPVTLPVGGEQSVEDYVDLFDAALATAYGAGYTPKLFVFSAPTFVTGTMLPIRALADLAIQNGIHTLVDGAHASGMFNLDFHALGVDFMACSGHKWQCGPGATGIWYIRNQTESNPLELPRFYPTNTFWYDTFGDGVYNAPDGGRYRPDGSALDIALITGLHGNPSYPAWAALGDVAQYWGAIGYQRIEDYILGLSAYLKDLVLAIWGQAAMYSAANPALQSALTAFVPLNAFAPTNNDSVTGSAGFVTRLREDYNLVVRNTTVHMPNGEDHYPLRVSTHLFHDRWDVDYAVEAIVDLAERFANGDYGV